MPRDYELPKSDTRSDLKIDYAAELNEQQYCAVTCSPGPALVIAGAGSGKTRTLTYRVAFLLEQGVPPEMILLLTFTNKAAQEMTRRVRELVGIDRLGVLGGTFHSVGARILRSHAELLGYKPHFSILDREDATALIKTCLIESSGPKPPQLPKPEQLAEHFSMALNQGIKVSQWAAKPELADVCPDPAWLASVFDAYSAKKSTAQVMDFDDLLVKWHQLLTHHDTVRELLQKRFQFILVDEYQDTNKVQGEIVDILAARHKNLMVVGDDAQSIYSWRGANFKNILDFPRRHEGTRVFRIEKNYRSTPQILALANAVIQCNKEQFSKKLQAVSPAGPKPAVVPCQEGQQQAAFIVARVKELTDRYVPLDQIAVLYRAHFHALEVQLALQSAGILFSITSGMRFFEQAHIKDITAYLKWIANPLDEVAFKRLIMLMPGIAEKGAHKLWEKARAQMQTGHPGDAIALQQSPGPSLARAMALSSAAVPKKAAAAWARVAATLAQVEGPAECLKPGNLLRTLLESLYKDHLAANYENSEKRQEDIEGLADFAEQFDGLVEFLTQVSLLTNVEAETETTEAQSQPRLRLSTVHQAKGLEFEAVFIIMLGDDLFPSKRSMASERALEEERRLFYVAVTRAKRELYLTFPLCRIQRGVGAIPIVKSRFLKEIPTNLFEEWNLLPYHTW